MDSYKPEGNTGDGKCHQKCGRGYMTKAGFYRHVQAFAQEPHRQPKGADRVAIPQMWSTEILQHAQLNSAPRQKVVIDLCCGYRSLAKSAKAMGLKYVGVDHIFRDPK